MNHKEMNAELARMCGQLGVYCLINAGEIEQERIIRSAFTVASIIPVGDAQFSGKGWVDGIAIGRRGALFIENKTVDGRRTQAQRRVALLLVARGLEYRMYRPYHYEDGLVRKDLEAIA